MKKSARLRPVVKPSRPVMKPSRAPRSAKRPYAEAACCTAPSVWVAAVVAALVHTLAPSPLAAQEPRLQTVPVDPLVDAEWLLRRIGDEDIVVVEAERRPGEFAEEHIAGARPLRFRDIAWEGEEGWIAEFREVDEMVEALRAAGVGRESKVVIYGTSMTAAARTWVTFDFLGLGDRAFLLNGGIEDWKAVGGPVESGESPPVEPGDVAPNAPVDFRVSADWVHMRLGDPSVVLLDARPDDEYTGTDAGLGGTASPGHIPGAAQLYWEELTDPANDTRFLPRDRIARILERHGADEGKTHVVYCMIGMRASVVYLAARMNGLDIHFYDGSWRDWGTRDDLPADIGPDPLDGPSDDRLHGFTADGTAAQRVLEARYDTELSADNLRERMEYIVSKPIYVGSPHNRETADWMVEHFRSWGFDADLAEYHVLFPTPRIRELEMVAPSLYTARLREPALAEDATSRIEENRLPPYNAFSADGEVTGELVYVNYGIPADYEELKRRGIDVRGRIVIARYGGSWRGIKAKVAHEQGAVGAILYSDPRDDGYFQGDTYPGGAYRQEHGVQRGSVLDMPQYPGDPLTPMVGAVPEAERLDRLEAPTIMKIPVLPISWGDAKPLLEALGGPVAPQSWRGALPLTYHLGPGPATVRLHVEFNWDLTPAYNVIARMTGSEFPDEWVIRGNHRDGWAMGAADPTSGMVALMEEARAIGQLAESGWRPRRTIVYAGWDAEEPALLGSTEWAEHHAAELKDKAAIYVNTDGNNRGFLNMGGSHSLEAMINGVARDVQDPQTGVSVFERVRARRAVGGDAEALSRGDLRISPLGSGSDYTPFLQHLGLPTLNLSFGGEGGGGSYHSQYDSFDYYTRFGDPGFHYGVALAQVTGRVTLRMANADVLPYRFAGMADNVRRYLGEVERLAADLRASTERENRLVGMDAYRLAADPTITYVPPEAKGAVPHLNFAPVQNAVAALAAAAKAYDAAADAALDGSAPALSADRAETLNDHLKGIEQLLTDDRGLPKRPWFRHQIYAPGFYTGYGVKTLPGIREAVEEREWELVPGQMERLAAALLRASEALEAAVGMLRGA